MAEVQKDKGVVVVAIGGGAANVHDLEPMLSASQAATNLLLSL